MLKLRVGDMATFIIPSELGYGGRGLGKLIAPHTGLILTIEVLGIK